MLIQLVVLLATPALATERVEHVLKRDGWELAPEFSSAYLPGAVIHRQGRADALWAEPGKCTTLKPSEKAYTSHQVSTSLESGVAVGTWADVSAEVEFVYSFENPTHMVVPKRELTLSKDCIDELLLDQDRGMDLEDIYVVSETLLAEFLQRTSVSTKGEAGFTEVGGNIGASRSRTLQSGERVAVGIRSVALNELLDRGTSLVTQTECNSGDQGACTKLGIMYASGKIVNPDHDRAFSLLEPACTAGEALACGWLGFMYANGYGTMQDEERAQGYLSKACDGGAHRACFHLGEILLDPEGGAETNIAARNSYKKACDARDARACASMGWLFAMPDLEGYDPTTAWAAAEFAGKEGIALGALLSAHLIVEGVVAVPDPWIATDYLHYACIELRDSESCQVAATYWNDGVFGKRGQKRWIRYYLNAADFYYVEQSQGQ